MTSNRRRAIAAATEVASALGLAIENAQVLQESNRLAVRLLPCDVLARVANEQESRRAEFELGLAPRLAQSQAPIGVLEPRVTPDAYVHDGFVVTLWTYYETAPSIGSAPADYARALERLHAEMRHIDMPTPHFTDRISEAQRLVGDRERTPALADADRDLLASTLQRLRQTVSTPQPPRATPPRRATSRQRASDQGRSPIYRPPDLLPGAHRVRLGPRARTGKHSIPARRSATAPRLSAPDACNGGGLALGSKRSVPKWGAGGAGIYRLSTRSAVRRTRLGARLILKGQADAGGERPSPKYSGRID